ncbi:hypothetical protein [Fluviicola taffensis]|uniref:Periplasmic heavy metal sensor n=1 Tax=Fluviicola taffensis (strain DSM 16823 / NCIMB 13979 / RW262) TaxID=755732 RepID=F2IHM0_FLUTR|nr:hypothetical protein [Fluviicola taffensis]AEA44798.1 hypothetical protein Fluta_2818 [Fluviicola taffensis DSM 16823]
MKKERFYQLIILTLILINGLLVFRMFGGKERHPHPFDGPRNQIIERLHFTPAQVKKYDLLIREHQKGIRGEEAILIQTKNELYSNLDGPYNDSIILQINQIQQNIEQIHLKHFKDIEQLCTSDQKVYFKELQKEIAQLFTRRMKPKRP